MRIAAAVPDYFPEDLSMTRPPLCMSWPRPWTVLRPVSVHRHITDMIATTIFRILL